MKDKLYLSETDKKIGGVCGGIAERFGLEISILRILVLIAILLFKGVPVFIYLLLWACLPRRSN